MKALKIVGLGILSLLLVITGWGYFLGMSLDRTVFSLSYYEGLLEQEEVDLQNIISEALEEIEIGPEEKPEEEQDEAMIPGMENLMQNIMADSLDETIDGVWVEEQILIVAEDILKLAKGKKDNLTAVIETEKLEEDLMKNMENRVKSISEEELLEAGVPQEKVKEVKDKFVDDFTKMMDDSPENNGLEMDLPAKIDLGQTMEEEITPEIKDVISHVQMFHTYFPVLPYIAFAIILLCCCLLAGLWGGLKWFGVAALLAGMSYFSGLLIARSLFLTPMLTEAAEELPVNLEMFLATGSFTIARMYPAPLIFSAVGLAFLAGGIILGKKQRF